MGTRGFITFAVEGKNKTVYNHFDSYPDGLGLTMLHFAMQADKYRDLVRDLKAVDEDRKPTAEEVEKLKPWTDMYVSPGLQGFSAEVPSWYQLLRKTQGMPIAILECGYYESASEFPADSLFAEWGYVVDFDQNVFEAYQGFQTQPHTEGRFASMERVREYRMGVGQYYPVRLVASWPLDNLPTREELLSHLEPSMEDEE